MSATPTSHVHRGTARSSRPSTEVAIIGAGITGLSIAWHLARAGVGSITILDGSGVGAGATAIQPGGVRQQWATELTCTMARESYLFYKDIDAALEPALSPSLDACGYLFVVESEQELAVLEERVSIQLGAGVPSRLLGPDELQALVPGLDVASVLGGSYCAEDGYFDRPQAVVEAFAAAAWRTGTLLVSESVRSLHRDGQGWRLELADGSSQLSERVVVAAAAPTASLVRPLGVELPITTQARHLFYSDPVAERLLEPLVVSVERHFAAKQLADGSVLASDLSASGNSESERPSWHRNIQQAISDLLPILEYVTFPVLVDGDYDVTPDAQPVLGAIPSQPGLWVAAGLNGRGFMMAPAVGRFIAESMYAGTTGDPLEQLAPDRFAAGRLLPERQVV